VSYYVAARARGLPVILVHDLLMTSSAYEMRPLFECLRWRRPTVAVDLPGYGLSARCSLPHSPALFGEVVGELARKLRRSGSGVDLVTLGRGSEVAVQLTCDDPALVRSVVMLEPTSLGKARGRPTLEVLAARLARLLGDGAARGLFALLATGPMVRRTLGSRFRGRPDRGLLEYARASAMVRGAHRAPLAAAAGWPDGERIARLYASMQVPVLVIHNARGSDAVELEAFLRARPNRCAVRLAPTRGMPQFERPVETLMALERFWHSLSRRTACDEATR
jgi:pimeloyl-ACP methyl ester carboxylesterase